MPELPSPSLLAGMEAAAKADTPADTAGSAGAHVATTEGVSQMTHLLDYLHCQEGDVWGPAQTAEVMRQVKMIEDLALKVNAAATKRPQSPLDAVGISSSGKGKVST